MDVDSVEIDESAVCRWLSWSFARELDEETLRVYSSGDATPLFDYLSRHENLTTPLARLDLAIAGWSELDDPKLELAADFATLFLVSGTTGAPLYASCYIPPGDLFGISHERMLKRLQGTDLAASTLSGEPADHLAIMLDYLAHCFAAQKSMPEISPAFEKPAEFIRTELLTWLPAFQEKAEGVEVASDMHKALVALTIEILTAFNRTSPDSAASDC